MKRLLYLLTITAAVILLFGCKGIKQVVEVPVEVHDTVYQKMVQHDSTYIDRWHTEYLKGDTVYVRDSFAVVRYIRMTDTAYKVVERPITVTRTETVEVEKRLHWWQKGLMLVGGLFLVLLVLWLAVEEFRK